MFSDRGDGTKEGVSPLCSTREKIERNLCDVRRRIDAAAARAGRVGDTIRLVAITKSVGVDEARILCELGVADLGENRVEAARAKIEGLGNRIRWHMVGIIQRRRCNEVVSLFDCVDSIDRVKVAEELQKRCDESGKTLDTLLEINVSGEATKHGFHPEKAEEALDRLAQMPNLRVNGLLTMAPLYDDPEKARPVFADLWRLADRLGLKELSMGMSNDFEVAVEEGATQVRIGTALFV